MIHAGVAAGRSIKTVTVKKLKIQDLTWKSFAESGPNSLHGKVLKIQESPWKIFAESGHNSLHGKKHKIQEWTWKAIAGSVLFRCHRKLV